MTSLVVIYDACVLYPAPLRDLLMYLALEDLYHARWTNLIHEEWITNLLSNRKNLTLDQLNRTRSLMDTCIRDSLVTGFEYLIPSINLPDPNDRHVVAAAHHAGASLIITFNLKDFPTALIHPYNLEAQHPDEFISNLFDIYPSSVLKAIASHRRSLKSPPKTTDEYFETLLIQGLNQLVTLIRPWALVI